MACPTADRSRSFVEGVSRSRRRSDAKPRGLSRSGIWLQISVACLLDVTFVAESHPNFKPYPCGALAPWFCLFAYAQPAELRLRKTQAFFSAQNDRLIGCFVVCVCFGMSRTPSPTGILNSALCILHSALFPPLHSSHLFCIG